MIKESTRCNKSIHYSENDKNNYSKRLNRIEGQIRGLNKMINEDRHCDDVLIQISAVNNAIKSLGQKILLNHMQTCMVEDIKNGKLESIDEIMDLCKRMM